MTKDNCFIITGSPGSGKSMILSQLKELGYGGIAEPARQILAEQRSINGNGIPDKDARLFIELMLSRAVYEYRRIEESEAPVFFDRGIPDNIAHASLYQIDFEPGWNAAERYRYNNLVFFTPNWEEIYENDDERTMSFKAASDFGNDIRKTYQKLGYTLIDIPFGLPEERAEYLVNSLKKEAIWRNS